MHELPPQMLKLDDHDIEQERLRTIHGFYFIDACEEEAKRWLAELCDRDSIEIQVFIKSSMRMFRRYDLSAGFALLALADHCLERKMCDFTSIISLLRRFEHSARAYAEYLEGDLDAAKASLAEAHLEISRIVSLHEFLVPVAMHCTDFVIQRARIARRERKWKEAKEHLKVLENIFADCHPYCILDSGKPIMLSDIRRFLASLPLNGEQRARARLFLGEDSPIRERIEKIEESVFSFPDVVIPYP